MQNFKENRGQINSCQYCAYFCQTIEFDNMIIPSLWFQKENMEMKKIVSEFPVLHT